MDRQPELDNVLRNVLGPDKEVQTYFQPPANVTMQYPCIRYELSRSTTLFADNRPYLLGQGYQLFVIDRDPNSEIREAVRHLPMTVFQRWYAVNGLNHFVFNTFF